MLSSLFKFLTFGTVVGGTLSLIHFDKLDFGSCGVFFLSCFIGYILASAHFPVTDNAKVQ